MTTPTTYDEIKLRVQAYKEDADAFGDKALMRCATDCDALLSLLSTGAAPIDMVLFCPKCGLQHIDAPSQDINSPGPFPCPDGGGVWDNPPHRSHLCHGCGHIWRPADVPTNGVKAIKTVGKADSPKAEPLRHNDRDAGYRRVVRSLSRISQPGVRPTDQPTKKGTP